MSVFRRQPKQAYPSPCAARASRSSIATASAIWMPAAAQVSCLGHSHPRVIEAIQAQAAWRFCPGFFERAGEALAIT